MESKKPSEIVPSPYGKLFEMYDSFNAVQTSLLNDLLYTDKSIVLSAPTGSGKTVAFELAIVKMLLDSEHSSGHYSLSSKAIYIAPIKALCSEKYENWKVRFESVGINCTQLTGDTQSANLMAMRQAQVVISTPEKWDSLTRRWRDFEQFLPTVKLFIVDEVHLLNEDTRGPILEAIVARMKFTGVKRFLVASATIPNAEDLTSWIGSCNASVKQYVFNELQRPVPLEKHVLGFNTKLKGFQFDMKLNYQLPEIIRKYAEQKATLIFCSSRKSAEMAAFNLNNTNSIFQLTNQQKTYLSQLTQSLIDTKLKKLVVNGIAYHHAGLQYADRNLIETSFREGFLMVLLSTSTLAMGINLPAHLVVIKSTETYMRGGYVEYPENMLLQMIGRAGRPQYDTKGIAVVLTQSAKVQKYKQLMNGKAPIESHLHKQLTEHLNSEIALNSISNLEMAMDWIRSTYLYVRSVRNPTHYGFPANMSKDHIEHKLEELSYKQIMALESAGLVTINKENGLNIQTTSTGKLMAKYYLCFETMKLFREIKENESLQNIFDLIIKCKELSEFSLRVNEKKVLNTLNKTPIRFPIKGRIKRSEDKISCLLQAVLGSLDITAPGLVQESLKMFRIAERVSKCLLEYVRLCVQKNLYSNTENRWYKTLLNAFTTAKCFHVKLWENSEYASKQLHGIGSVYSTLLLKAGKTTLKEIAKTEARTIEYILNKAAPFGDEVLQNLLTFPEYELKLLRKSTDSVAVYAKQINESYVHKSGAIAVLIVGDSMNNLLLLAENFDDISMEYGCFERTIQIKNSNDIEYIYGHVVHTSLVGVDVHDSLEINAPKEPKKEKTAKKAKKQTRLSIIHNGIMNESNVSAELNLNKENNKICDEEVETRNNQSKLKKFEFTKKKIVHDEQSNKSMTDAVDNPLNNETIQPLNETSCTINDICELNFTNGSRIVQRKLTDFFAQRKKTESLAINTSTINLTKEVNSENRENTTRCGECSSYKNPSVPHKQLEIIVTNNNYLNDTDKACGIVGNRMQMKRQNATHDSESQSSIKRKKASNDFSFDVESKPCAISLASFLGDMGERSTVTSLLQREITQKALVQKRVCSKTAPMEVLDSQKSNKQYSQPKTNTITKPKTIQPEILANQRNQRVSFDAFYTTNQNTTEPIDLSKSSFREEPIKPTPINKTNTLYPTQLTNVSHCTNPTDEEFELWFKVAVKFQRLPIQAMSLKNFRHVYNKVLQKEQQSKNQMSLTTSSIEQLKNNAHSFGNDLQKSMNQLKKISDNSSLETSHSSSSANSFRLQLFENRESGLNNKIQRSAIKMINHNVMKYVLQTKCTQNMTNAPLNFDEDLTTALEEFDRKSSHHSGIP